MRRVLLTAAIAALVVTFAVVAAAGGDDGTGGTYEVRAVFENGGFVVKGENVRIAGANVGAVKSVDVSMPGEIVSLEGGPHAIPGKAVVVLDITDGGFKDFRQDASCLIRPQSLIGEKFVDCQPTQPRAPGSKPPPLLKQIPDGQEGAGEYLLPLENNGKAVDLDLIQNIQRLPYAERFRLIINDLGAGLAGRGEDLNEIVRKSSPALQATDNVLKILAAQNKQLAQLSKDSDTILQPLARERGHLAGFIRSAGQSATATAERGSDLALNLQKLPATLVELRKTMVDLGGFSNAAKPFFQTLGAAAPTVTTATRLLGPFSDATTVSLKSLGNAAEQAGPDLRAADPIVLKLRGLAFAAQRPTTNLAKLTGSLHTQGAFESLSRFIYNTSGSFNGVDKFGHFLRTNILVSSCIEYQTFPFGGCVANFTGPGTPEARNPFSQEQVARAFGLDRPSSQGGGVTAPVAKGDKINGLFGADSGGSGDSSSANPAVSRDGGIGVLDYLLKP